MLSKKSIRTEFVLQLIPALAVLIAVFSIILYSYLKISIIRDIDEKLIQEVKEIAEKHTFDADLRKGSLNIIAKIGYKAKIELVNKKNGENSAMFEKTSAEGKDLLSVYYPYETLNSIYLKMTYDVTYVNEMLNKIAFSIFMIGCFMIVVIVFYAFVLSSTLLLPIKTLNYKLANMNESFLKPIDTSSFPDEFIPLGKSVNRLIGKIQTFVRYQKEFFIGIAHELKTPLAVMKTKNEVTLIKERDKQAYVDALKKNISTIDEMNSMISSILEIGRQEGAQFEQSVKIDLIKFLNNKANDFKIVAESRQSTKRLIVELSPKSYKMTIQPTLVAHILQNFIQNAFKFCNENSDIIMRSYAAKSGFVIEVLNEGKSIDESVDFFAPFKRFGDKIGAGLGLFLAKNAADAIGGAITLKNRTDGVNGVSATLFMPNQQKNR